MDERRREQVKFAKMALKHSVGGWTPGHQLSLKFRDNRCGEEGHVLMPFEEGQQTCSAPRTPMRLFPYLRVAARTASGMP
jgi:hypothetical protein